MKVYLFYQTIPNLEPVLYGFTSDKLRAAIFKLYRPKLKEVIKDVSKKDYTEMKDKLRGKEIIPHDFQTRNDHFGIGKVSQIATEHEVMNIILHKEELVLKELSKYTLPLEIFSSDMRKNLRRIYMDIVNKYWEEIILYPGDNKNIPYWKFKVDELGLFVQLYGYMMSNDKKK